MRAFLVASAFALSGCASRRARGSISYCKVVKLLQSSHDVRDYLRTCGRRIERNLPIIVYASVSKFSHSHAGHSFTLSRLAVKMNSSSSWAVLRSFVMS